MSYLWQVELMTNFDNGRGVFRKSYIITEIQNKVFDAKLQAYLFLGPEYFTTNV